ncbi:unnamed protein product [Symbiodinium microadriaticum]|nr:unnamed protein product [Symbiodinium microadriaticum]
MPAGLKAASLAHLDGGLGLVKGFQDFFGADFLLVRSLEHVKRNIRDQGAKKLRQSSWWTSTKTWVATSAFFHNDHVFDRYWHYCFLLLEKHEEAEFLAYLKAEHFKQTEVLWTASWRAATLEPGYGSYALNSVDAFFGVLDDYVPEEKSLPLRELMRHYEHAGRVFENESMWSEVCVEPSKLLSPTLLGEVSGQLSKRLEYKGGKQVGRLTAKTLKRMLAEETPMMLEVEAGEGQTTKVFCKYGPAAYNEQEMTALAELENAKSAEAVETAFQDIGALDENGFHPRIVRALYDKFTALHEEAGKLLESHHDFWQCGMTEHMAHIAATPQVLCPKRSLVSTVLVGEDLAKPALVDEQFADPFDPGAGGQPELLGAANEGVPAAVHQEMQRLAEAGVLPITTPEQRARNRCSGGSEYGVPAAFADARRFSYVHPNFPPPTGYFWRCRGSEWTLCVKGG